MDKLSTIKIWMDLKYNKILNLNVSAKRKRKNRHACDREHLFFSREYDLIVRQPTQEKQLPHTLPLDVDCEISSCGQGIAIKMDFKCHKETQAQTQVPSL